jgi:hypothetical protein
VRCLTLSLVSKGHVAPQRRELEHASLSQHRPPVSPPHQPSINLPWPPPSPRTKLASRRPPHTPTAHGCLIRAIALACRSTHSSTQAPAHTSATLQGTHSVMRKARAPIPHHPWCSHAPLHPRPSREVAALLHTRLNHESHLRLQPRSLHGVVCLQLRVCAHFCNPHTMLSAHTHTHTQQPVCWLPSCVRIAMPLLSHHLELFLLVIASTTLPMAVVCCAFDCVCVTETVRAA